MWTGLFNGFQSVVGLVLLSIVSAAAIAEDRSRRRPRVAFNDSAIDAEPRLQQVGACYRGVLFIALLPTLVALAHAAKTGRWSGGPLVLGTVLAQGAAFTSLGIALATWFSRIERALFFSVAACVMMTVAWIPFVLLLFGSSGVALGLAAASPVPRYRSDHNFDP